MSANKILKALTERLQNLRSNWFLTAGKDNIPTAIPRAFFSLEISSSNFHILRILLLTIKILVLFFINKMRSLPRQQRKLLVSLVTCAIQGKMRFVAWHFKCVLWESSRLITEVSYFPQKSWSFVNCFLKFLLIVSKQSPFQLCFLEGTCHLRVPQACGKSETKNLLQLMWRTLRLDNWHWIIY